MNVKKGGVLLWLCVCFILCAYTGTTSAREERWDKWRRYENDYFVIRTDVKQEKVLKFLEDLEKFRLVIEKALTVKIPEGAKKTNVLLFKSKRQFSKHTPSRNLAGFMTYIAETPTMVMPYGKKGFASTIIKHEYVHVVQAYDAKKYPKWVEEGIAELLSTVIYYDELGVFGAANKERWQYISRELNYNKVINGDYYRKGRISRADVYAQYWLLVAYSLTAPKRKYLANFGDYLTRYRNGEDSVEAFTQAYGMDAQAFGKEAMKNYSKKSYQMEPLAYKYDPIEMDIDLKEVDLQPTEMKLVMNWLKRNIEK